MTPLLRDGTDFSFSLGGRLAQTFDFDLTLGDDQQNALSRLRRRWRLNEPMLHANFAYVMDAFVYEKSLYAQLDDVIVTVREQAGADRYHAIRDEIAVLSFSRDSCAGSIMVVLANLLHRLRVDLGFPKPNHTAKTPRVWYESPPLFAGHSFGVVLDAAAANFRS